MSSKEFRPIILAGGAGKRLWPLSTKERPKQFIPLFGDLTLFDLTLQRINNRDLFKKPIIVTSEEYLSLVEESLSKTVFWSQSRRIPFQLQFCLYLLP